jgi:hypothetical protein
VKLFDAHWRNGRALSFFINGAIFGPLKENSIYKKQWFAIASCWSFILWESTFPLALMGPLWAVVWCSIAAISLPCILAFWFESFFLGLAMHLPCHYLLLYRVKTFLLKVNQVTIKHIVCQILKMDRATWLIPRT